MPLKSGYSQNTISANIEEMLHKYKQTGKIGSSHPKNMEDARRIAAAAAYAKAREAARKIRSRTKRDKVLHKLTEGKRS